MHPFILSGKHHITSLLVRHHHKQVHHQGRHFTEGAVRAAGFWIVGGKRSILKTIHYNLQKAPWTYADPKDGRPTRRSPIHGTSLHKCGARCFWALAHYFTSNQRGLGPQQAHRLCFISFNSLFYHALPLLSTLGNVISHVNCVFFWRDLQSSSWFGTCMHAPLLTALPFLITLLSTLSGLSEFVAVIFNINTTRVSLSLATVSLVAACSSS
ncbi:unnamed protein product [Acanthosepion pharaonis]|uniref:Uncharacterized protein n=1 Tax=Acanthosepion pharaonis TaxID=158019 RepID=A0A812D790_ACAPH|nr:unnamed protein product [Sepia pharaonis]